MREIPKRLGSQVGNSNDTSVYHTDSNTKTITSVISVCNSNNTTDQIYSIWIVPNSDWTDPTGWNSGGSSEPITANKYRVEYQATLPPNTTYYLPAGLVIDTDHHIIFNSSSDVSINIYGIENS